MVSTVRVWSGADIDFATLSQKLSLRRYSIASAAASALGLLVTTGGVVIPG